MPRKKHSPEQIVGKLRQIEIDVGSGQTTSAACKKANITEQTYYRWRKEYGGMKVDQTRRLKELEKENARLKRLLADKELDLSILKEVAEGKF